MKKSKLIKVIYLCSTILVIVACGGNKKKTQEQIYEEKKNHQMKIDNKLLSSINADIPFSLFLDTVFFYKIYTYQIQTKLKPTNRAVLSLSKYNILDFKQEDSFFVIKFHSHDILLKLKCTELQAKKIFGENLINYKPNVKREKKTFVLFQLDMIDRKDLKYDVEHTEGNEDEECLIELNSSDSDFFFGVGKIIDIYENDLIK